MLKTNLIHKRKGITLIALVVSIVVLLILAGVSIAMLTGENGIITQAQKAKKMAEKAEREEKYLLGELEAEINGEATYNETKQVNNPKITTGMIPIKWNGTNWVVCSQEDEAWYDYGTKNWANMMLSDGTYKSDTVNVGQVVQEADLGSMYVWIPRYAYKIASEGRIDVVFLKGNTNVGTDNVTYTTDQNTDTKQTSIVHPAFNSSGKSLTGIWVAKFEASGTDKQGNAVGNASSSSSAQQYAPDETTIAKSLPNKISWRHITIGESQARSMAIASTDKEKYGLKYASSHLMKNDEWGAVAYLCYSDYGTVPKINGAGNVVSGSHYYNMYTGQGPVSTTSEGWYNRNDNTHNYDTSNGMLASTTGNVTGVYDMNGGSWEIVAAYLDNKHGNLNTYGKSNDGTLYFENGELKSEYANLWNAYEVSEEEREDKIEIGIGSGVTRSKGQIWGTTEELRGQVYQEARYRITKATYDNMASHKGIGVNETAKGENPFSFYAPYINTEGTAGWGWFLTAEQAVTMQPNSTTTYAHTWDNDNVQIGHSACPFMVRGGHCNSDTSAGVLYMHIAHGYASYLVGFRSVVIL